MDAAIFDVDGTLCDVSSVRHYVEGDKKDFYSFHTASLFCPPVHYVAAMSKAYHRAGLAIIVVTARDARYERVTRDWLHKHQVPYSALYMRPWGDQRRDYEVKREILTQILISYNPVVAVDDRDDIIAVWREANIETHKVVTHGSTPPG